MAHGDKYFINEEKKYLPFFWHRRIFTLSQKIYRVFYRYITKIFFSVYFYMTVW